jgi:CheY-like chemotaxis protein
VSGNIQPEDINRAKTAATDDFVAKPIDRKHLIGLLDKLNTAGQPTSQP